MGMVEPADVTLAVFPFSLEHQTQNVPGTTVVMERSPCWLVLTGSGNTDVPHARLRVRGVVVTTERLAPPTATNGPRCRSDRITTSQ